ncbi:MAG: putative glycoside hydrolase [Patescibacteria group bacterium]
MIRGISLGVALLGALGITSFALGPTALSTPTVSYSHEIASSTVEALPPPVEHRETPHAVKAIYMSQCAASSESFRASIIGLADTTEINAVIVDIKDYTGTTSFPSKVALSGGKGCTVPDFREVVKRMHEHDIYVIGRLTVFQDPLYTSVYPDRAVKKATDGTTWRDNKGLAFVDVGAAPFWEYIEAIAREAHGLGVDEINFDYIRYPSDGPMDNINFTHTKGSHADNLERFFSHLNAAMKIEVDGHRPIISADLFGMTTTNTDDLNIGQVLERTMPYFDYIAPMVYPSHYPRKFNGWDNPNQHVYGVIEHSMRRAVERAEATTTPVAGFKTERIGTTTPAVYAKKPYSRYIMRPWLQDFDYGGNYGPKEVRDQIQATYDIGLTSWMLWDPSNRYTKDALLPE